MVAVVGGDQIFTSVDSGLNWTAQGIREWGDLVSTADGTKLAALVGPFAFNQQLYTSIDSGITWTLREPEKTWSSVATSADGRVLIGTTGVSFPLISHELYRSTDFGVSWALISAQPFLFPSVALSDDGLKIVVVDGLRGFSHSMRIYFSTDTGNNWRFQNSVDEDLGNMALSGDGSKLIVATSERLYIWAEKTATGASGSITGSSYNSITLQYIGNSTFTIISHEGLLGVQ
ncbi:MAG: hypothetical protein KUG82_02035 [Pseudomonadales bacterium]|nr:hypothetical protein [Pseudomonadales bacterium]